MEKEKGITFKMGKIIFSVLALQSFREAINHTLKKWPLKEILMLKWICTNEKGHFSSLFYSAFELVSVSHQFVSLNFLSFSCKNSVCSTTK